MYIISIMPGDSSNYVPIEIISAENQYFWKYIYLDQSLGKYQYFLLKLFF